MTPLILALPLVILAYELYPVALVTVLIIAFVIVALINFQGYLTYSDNFAQQQAEATIIAVNQLETLRNFQTLNNTTGYNSYANITSGNANINGVNTTYNASWEVISNTNPTYKTINMTVGWLDMNNTTQSITLATDIAGIEPANSAIIM